MRRYTFVLRKFYGAQFKFKLIITNIKFALSKERATAQSKTVFVVMV
jgi:hypothetical protein